MKERQPLTEICKKQQQKNAPLPTAEIMFDEVVGREFIYGAVVKTEKAKAKAIAVLEAQGIKDINGVPLADAIHVEICLKK